MAVLDSSQHPCPYESLSDTVSSDLQVVVHFMLVFRDAVQLQPPALLYPHLELSLLSARGNPYRSLTYYIASALHRAAHRIRKRLEPLSSTERIRALRDLIEDVVAAGNVRRECSVSNVVAPFVRARACLRDSQRRPYMWLRGADESSTRFLVGSRLLIASEDQVKQHVGELAATMRRSDVVAASWLSSRFERAQNASQDVHANTTLTRAYTTEANESLQITDVKDDVQNGNASDASASTTSERGDRSFTLDSDWEQTDDSQSDDDEDPDDQQTSDDDWMQIEVFRRRKLNAPTVRGRHHVKADIISARSLRAERRFKARSIPRKESSPIKKPMKSDRQKRMERRTRRAQRS